MTTNTQAPSGSFRPFQPLAGTAAGRMLGIHEIVDSPNADGTPTPEEAAAALKLIEDKAAADKIVADKAAADKIIADKAEADRIAAEAAKVGDPEKAKLLKETMERKAHIKVLEEKMKLFDGIDPEKARAAMQKEIDAEKLSLEKKGEYDRLTEMQKAEHEKDTSALKAKIKALEDERPGFISTIEDLTVGQSFATSTYLKEDLLLSPTKARQLYGPHFDTEDGKIVGYDKPRGAPARTKLVNASGEVVDFETAFKRIIEADPDKPTLLKVKTGPGSGGRQNVDGVVDHSKDLDTGLRGAARIAAGMAADKAKK